MTSKKLPLKRIRYYTMNSWNLSMAPAYNMKIYNIIRDSKIRSKLCELMGYDNAYDEVNRLIYEFERRFDYKWQAGFNGRSGGYLVLYKGGCNDDGRIFTQPGQNIEDKEVPTEVLKAFRKLALNIQSAAIELAENAKIEEVEVVRTEKRLVLNEGE